MYFLNHINQWYFTGNGKSHDFPTVSEVNQIDMGRIVFLYAQQTTTRGELSI